MRKFLRFTFVLLIIASCKHDKYVASGNSNQPFPKAKRKKCEVLPSFYSIDTMKTLKGYIECLSVRKMAYEHFCYTVISNVNVVDVKNGKLQKNMTVILHDSEIDSVFSSGEKLPGFPKEYCVKYVSGSGKYLAPGLCDMHTHYDCGLKNRFRFLLDGTTTIRSMGNQLIGRDEMVLLTNRTIVGPNLYVVNSQRWDAIDSVLITENYDWRNSQYYERHISNTKYDSAYMALAIEQAGTHAVSLSIECFIHLPRFFFPPETVFERRTDFTYIRQLPNYNNFWFVFKYTDPDRDQLADERNESPSVFNAIKNNDGQFCIGTESGQTDNNAHYSSIIDEMQSLCDSGVSRASAIRMATYNAGEMMHATTDMDAISDSTIHDAAYWQLRFGEVKENYRADLVLLNANPLDDVKNYSKINFVFLNGTCFTRDDLNEIKAALTKW